MPTFTHTAFRTVFTLVVPAAIPQCSHLLYLQVLSAVLVPGRNV